MYNSLQKERYISDKESDTILAEGFLDRIFNKSESFEEELQKDICQFTTSEILDFYKVLNVRSLDSLLNYHSQYLSYGSWCMQQSLIPDGINHFNELNLDILKNCVNKAAMEDSIITEEQLYEILSKLINPRDQFVLIMLFETGKSTNQENIFYAKLSDINEETKTMKLHDGREVNISYRLIGIAENASKDSYYEIYNPSPNAPSPRRPLEDNGYIFKDTTSARSADVIQRMNRLNRSMSTALKYLGYKKSWTKLNTFAESGIIHEIKKLQTETGKTAEQVLRDPDLRKQINNQHNAKINSVPNILRKYEGIL